MRKKIAIVTGEVNNNYINGILDGIKRQCVQLDYDACVLLMTFNKINDTIIQIGEENIYSLITPEAFAGVVLMKGNMQSRTLIEKIERTLIEDEIPTIAVDCESRVCESVYAEDSYLFEMITDHFAVHHNCREIMCFTGPENNNQSQSRLLGYKKSLEKNGIPYNEELVVYGDFWINSAHKLADEFVSGKRKMPDAIVCACDIMATTLCNTLINSGVNIPGDVRISGHDCSNEALYNIPSITSIFPENNELGARAICRLHKKITGEEVSPVCGKNGCIVTAQSCGCGEDLSEISEIRETYKRDIGAFETLYRTSGMAEGLFSKESLDEFLKRLCHYMYLINGLERYVMCLCENWDNIVLDNNEEDTVIHEGYSENMIAKMFYTGLRADYDEIKFSPKDVLPYDISIGFDKPNMYFLLPIHFNDCCFGYSVFSFTDVKYSLSSLFARWSRNINVGLEFLRVRTKLISMNQRTFLSSVRDTLTGIYNRKGFKRFSDSMFKKAKAEQKKLLILFADLDLLKHINDNFGHIEGDNAIIVTANVLNTCCKCNEVCARIGGDEYAIIGCYDYTEEILKGYIEYITEYFDRYNASSGKPYKVGASIGYYCGVPDDDAELQDYLNIADKRMYDNKFERKKQRFS